MRIQEIGKTYLMVKNDYEGTMATSIIAAGYGLFWNSRERPLDSNINHKRAFLQGAVKAEQICGAVFITATASAIVALAACKIFIPVIGLTSFLLLITAVAIHSFQNPPKIPSPSIQVQQQIVFGNLDEQVIKAIQTTSPKVVEYLKSFDSKESADICYNLDSIALHIATLPDKQFLIDQNKLRDTEADYVFHLEFKKRVETYYDEPFSQLTINQKIGWVRFVDPFAQ